jgi:monofunctional biosynthetic peptidoglycan transglycosylase
VRRLIVRALVALTLVVSTLVAVALVRTAAVDVDSLAKRDPERSALMRQREREARASGKRYRERHRPVRLDRVSPTLRAAVLVAEDDKFFAHEGFDWAGIREAARRNLRTRKVVRGGSTITQQLAKNLWLGTARTPWRKFEEMILAYRLERALPKRRILELYLNTIEWGDGVYGIEAAARHWYGVGAGALDARQSLGLAAIVINPRRYSPTDPSPRIERRIRTFASRLRRRGAISEAEYRAVVGLPPEAPAPAVDSTLFGPGDLAPAPDAVPEAAPSETAPADSAAAPA